MTTFVILHQNTGRAAEIVQADTLPDAEAMGRALCDTDEVIAYHASQVSPELVKRLMGVEGWADGFERCQLHRWEASRR